MPEEAQYELRAAFYAHRQLLEAFVQENPQRFSAEELALVASWQHGVHGQFYVLRHLQRYTSRTCEVRGGITDEANRLLGHC
jgi:hypothetical protein